jgi:dipeptidyl aminopeptidase/acylaminoacyl peptidase
LPAVGGHTQEIQSLIAAVHGEVVPFHLADYAVLTANAEGNAAYGQLFIDRGMLEYLEHDISSLRLMLAY